MSISFLLWCRRRFHFSYLVALTDGDIFCMKDKVSLVQKIFTFRVQNEIKSLLIIVLSMSVIAFYINSISCTLLELKSPARELITKSCLMNWRTDWLFCIKNVASKFAHSALKQPLLNTRFLKLLY